MPPVNLLEAFTTVQDEQGNLTYPKLDKSVRRQKGLLAKRWAHFLRQPDGLLQRHAANNLAQVYLQETANEYLNATTKLSGWGKRFTDASIDIYGSPNKRQVSMLAATELKALKRGSLPATEQWRFDFVREVYQGLAGSTAMPAPTVVTPTMSGIRRLVAERYSELFGMIESQKGAVLTSLQLAKICKKALKILAKKDSAWAEWRVMLTQSAIVSVSADTKTIKIGKKRALMDKTQLISLLAHEILVHASRAVEGAKTKDPMLAGLFGGGDYVAADEGLAIYLETALSGELPAKAKDRYIDIALALGMNKDLGKLPRNDLFAVAYNRAILHAYADGRTINEDQLVIETWTHVNRIFRGTPGDRISGGVFTKDIVYYEGFLKMHAYIESAAKCGNSPAAIWDYVTCAKFDPTQKLHVEYVRAKTGKTLR